MFLRNVIVSALLCLPVSAADVVMVPKSSGAIANTAKSMPFGMESKTFAPVDLAKHGYVEEEFILSGAANVYDWASDGSVSVRTANAPYTNRVLVRRPASNSKFSGTVVVEISNAARRFDWDMMWGYVGDHIVERGDAWVGLTLPQAIDSLKKFDDDRYGALSMANPTPGAACPGAAKGGPAAFEEGLRWDYYSQTAAALKSNMPGQPMAGMNVKNVILTTQAGDIVSYIDIFHDRARLASGKPLYDGYLVRGLPRPAKLSQCAPAIPAGDARQKIKDIDVPVMNVAAQGEVPEGLRMRKDDSDAIGSRYRLYEIAGAAHIDWFAYRSMPSMAEQNAIGLAQGTVEWPFNIKCEPEIPLSKHELLRDAFNGALGNLEDWLTKGVAPPKAPRLETGTSGELVLDEFGHAEGGVRSPWVDAPVATYTMGSPGPATCRELGTIKPFDAGRIAQLYPSTKDYTAKVNASVDKAAKQKYFTESAAKQMKEELAKGFPKK